MPLLEGVKNSYEEGEIFEPKTLRLSDQDKAVLKSKKTWAYYYIKGSDQTQSKYIDITDKNICFNANQFSDLANLVNCGYATINFINGDTTYTIKTCYYINNKQLPLN